MTRLLKRIPVLVLAAAALTLVFGVGAAPAKQKACWRVLINDWYDGRIDEFYPLSCYRAALANAPEDLSQYSDLRSDLAQAMKNTRRLQGKTYVNYGARGKGKPEAKPDERALSSSDPAPSKRKQNAAVIAAGGNGSNHGGGPLGSALQSTGGSDADSVPIPLLALGALALLLLASGATGLVARGVRARRATSHAAPDA